MSSQTASAISRRNFLLQCSAGAAVLALGRSAKGQGRSGEVGKLRLKLVKEITGAYLHSVSPDSERLCLSSTRKAVGKLTVWDSIRGQRTVKDQPPPPSILSVVEIGSWRQIYSSSPLGGLLGGFFFSPGSDVLFGYTFTTGTPALDRWMRIDLPAGGMEERERPHDGFYLPLTDRRLIGFVGARQDRRLIEVEWPQFREVRRVAVREGTSSDSGWTFAWALDRKRLLYLSDQSLVCRRVEDFSVVWTRQVDPDIDLKARLPRGDPEKAPHAADARYRISADGSTAVLAPFRTKAYPPNERRFYIEILNGSDGKPVARWPMDPNDGVLMSPDGKLFGRLDVVGAGPGDLNPTVHLYEVPSGREVATVVHDHMPSSQRLHASLVGTQFTPDGRYLLTSANSKVKVWQVEWIA